MAIEAKKMVRVQTLRGLDNLKDENDKKMISELSRRVEVELDRIYEMLRDLESRTDALE